MNYVPRMALADEQHEAIDQAERRLRFGASVTAISGPAGSGKTHVLAALAERHPDAYLVAPTNVAADVLRRRCQRPATTIHRLIYVPETLVDQQGHKTLRFRRRQASELRGRLVLLDEGSMVNDALLADLRRTGVRVVATFDPFQLPPVVGDPAFTDPDVVLNTVHRTALDSPILRQATRVRNGLPPISDTGNFTVKRKASMDDLLAADVVLCWRNSVRTMLIEDMREALGYRTPLPFAGEPMMSCSNSAELGLWNGSICTVAQNYSGDGPLRLIDDGEEVTIECPWIEGAHRGTAPEDAHHMRFAYALTTHKAQGNEWGRVLVVAGHSPDPRWLYTAITRARQSVVVAHCAPEPDKKGPARMRTLAGQGIQTKR